MSRPKTGQAPAPDWTLTTEQSEAVDLLANGKTVSEIAQALDVESQTIRQWRTQHYGVQAALNVLEQELEGENRLQAAVHVLKACKLYGLSVVAGPTEVEDIAIAAQARMQERQTKALLAGIDNGRFA